MEPMKQIILQEINEERYNRKHIDTKIREEIRANPFMDAKIQQGIKLLNDYLNTEYKYTLKDGTEKIWHSKNNRIEQIKDLDTQELVEDIFVGIAYFQSPELFTSASAQIASRLRLSYKEDAIRTTAEILAILAQTDAFDIIKEDAQASLELVSCISLSDDLVKFILGSQVLPPMVCSPLKLEHNYSSGYLTHNDSLILGPGNHHDGDICLDVLNIINNVALKLDTEFLSKVEEEPNHEFETERQAELWQEFKEQSYEFYKLMVECGNKFYFNHKVDKRGRIYSQGYHINPQGAPFKKSSLELWKQELVQGVPDVSGFLCE